MDFDLKKSFILITDDSKSAIEKIIKKVGLNYKIFSRDNFLIEDAHELISHSYISSETDRFMIVSFKTINNVSQNALLKLFEEPPKNVIFILIAPSKSIFLPTIKSRLPIYQEKINKKQVDIDFDFKNFDLKTILEFSKTRKHLSKDEAKRIIEFCFGYYVKKTNGKRFDLFDKSFRLIELNSTPINVIVNLLLEIRKARSELQTINCEKQKRIPLK